MAGGHVQGQGLGVKKLFLACRALKGEMALMLLHMIMHGILLLLRHLANGANEQAIGILLVFHRHG